MQGLLDVVGHLVVETGGESARIEARGDRIVVELTQLRSGRAFLQRLPGVRGRRKALRRIHESLRHAGLTLQVNVGSNTIGILGVGAQAGLASRLLGLDPLEIRIGGVLASLRRPVDRPE